MPAPLLYFELEPAPDIAPWVRSFWGFEVRGGDPHEHIVWPDGCISITWGRMDDAAAGEPLRAGVLGPTADPIAVPVAPGHAYRGIRFHPHTGGALLRMRAAALRGQSAWLPAAGEPAADLARAIALPATFDQAIPIFEDWVRRWVPPPEAVDELAGRAAALIEAAPSRAIRDVAAALALSDRQLRRRFRAATGLSPKEWARIRRMRGTLAEFVEGDAAWSMLAAAHGYADQSHLVHELVRLTRLTPGQLAKRLRLIEHRDVRA